MTDTVRKAPADVITQRWFLFRGDEQDPTPCLSQYEAEDACEDDEAITHVEAEWTRTSVEIERYSVFNRYERRCQGVKFK